MKYDPKNVVAEILEYSSVTVKDCKKLASEFGLPEEYIKQLVRKHSKLNSPRLLRTLDFGKYKDQPIDYVISFDPKYIDWCLKNIPKFRLKYDVGEFIGYQK